MTIKKDKITVFIQVEGIGFTFGVDTMSKYNFVSPCFVDFFHEEYLPSQEKLESSQIKIPTSEDPISTPLYLFTDVFKREKGIKKIRCKDGENKGCESVTLKFECDGKRYSELFYIDQSLCKFCTPKNRISGILGIDFLKKHKWCIDFSKRTVKTK